jgi:hypothetical protein
MFDCHEWMTNFVPIAPRSWQVAIVDDSHLMSMELEMYTS